MINLAAYIESVLEMWTAAEVVNVVVLVLLVVFLTALVSAARGRAPGFVHYAPNLLTTVGILGTFVGILIGLLGFDVTDIDGSIAPLLDGLKTAFITSLVGMFLAILFKGLDSTGKLRPRQERETSEHVGPEDIYAELRAQRDATEKLAQSIAGDEDSALISQIRLMRSDNNEQSKAVLAAFDESEKNQKQRLDEFSRDLWKKLDQVAEMLSKSATEQVINALKDVVADFNKNLTEQFGENFKRLNAAVEDLVQWQENYREQLAQMNDQYSYGVQAITQTAQSIDEISNHTQQIPETMNKLRTVMQAANHQLQELERHLEVFREMRDRAVEAVPQIRDQMDQMVSDVSSATKDAGEKIMDATEKTRDAIVSGAEEFENRVTTTNKGLVTASDALSQNSDRIREQLDDTLKDLNDRVRNMLSEVTDGSKIIGSTLVEANKTLDTDIKEVQYQVTDSIDTMQKRLESTLEELTQSQTREVSKAAEVLEQELNKSVARTGDAVNKQMDAIDQAMANELERVMKAMGESLASISNKFTEDYSRLTDQMSQVVAEAKKVNRAGTQ